MKNNNVYKGHHCVCENLNLTVVAEGVERLSPICSTRAFKTTDKEKHLGASITAQRGR